VHTVKFIVEDRTEEIRVDGFQGAHSVGMLLERVPEVKAWECVDESGRFCASWDRDKQ
jgi:hypothetical protein